MRREEIADLLFSVPWEDLQARAAAVTVREKGSHVFVRGLIEFSNICHRNCRYCGLRAPNVRLGRYAMSRDEILSAAREAVACGADTIVLQSGEYAVQPQWLAGVIAAIRQELHVPVTLSVGEQPAAACALWKEAGAERYLLKHETADPAPASARLALAGANLILNPTAVPELIGRREFRAQAVPAHSARIAAGIVSVNADAAASIFNVAHVGVVGDIYEIVPRLIARIQKEKEAAGHV